MAAEAKRIAQSDIDLTLSRPQRHIIHLKVAAFVLMFKIDSRRDNRFVNDLNAYISSTAPAHQNYYTDALSALT